MRFPAPSEATPNAFNRGNVAERLIGTRVILQPHFLRTPHWSPQLSMSLSRPEHRCQADQMPIRTCSDRAIPPNSFRCPVAWPHTTTLDACVEPDSNWRRAYNVYAR